MDYEIGNFSSGPHWFAVWTRSRQEKSAAAMLSTLGVTHFLPLISQVHQWSDRKQICNSPSL